MKKESVYILQKDTIRTAFSGCCVLKEGTILSLKNNYYSSKEGWTFPKEFVENNPEWFREHEDDKVTQCIFLDEEVKFLIIGNESNDYRIKNKRLVEIILAESKGELFIDNLEGIKSRQGTYTEKEYDAIKNLLLYEITQTDYLKDKVKELMAIISKMKEVKSGHYTQKDLLDAEERVFNDVKSIIPDLLKTSCRNVEAWMNFKTFSRYKNFKEGSKKECAVRNDY